LALLSWPGWAADAGEDAVVAAMDALQRRRDDPEAQKQMEQVITDGLAQNPESYGVLWRAARFECWVAETTSADALKKTAAKRAWDFGDKARQVAPNAAEGHYYAAAGVGLFGQAMGVMTAVSEGVAGKFNDRIDRAIQIDPATEGGGPLLARGRYYYEVPFLMRDLKKSANFLGRALEKHPENLRARWYLAQTLLKDGKALKAKEEIDRVLAGDEGYDPPDARRVKGFAVQTQREIAEALK
jgi:cytochrome c-type biogenesis protein CcmH/NrfG